MLGTLADIAGIFLVNFCAERAVHFFPDQFVEAHNAVQWRTQLVAHLGQKLGFVEVGCLGGKLGRFQFGIEDREAIGLPGLFVTGLLQRFLRFLHIGDIDDLGDEIDRYTVIIADQMGFQHAPDHAPVFPEIAFLQMADRGLAVEDVLHHRAVSFHIVGMGDLTPVDRAQFLNVIADEIGPCLIGTDQRAVRHVHAPWCRCAVKDDAVILIGEQMLGRSLQMQAAATLADAFIGIRFGDFRRSGQVFDI